MCLYVLCMVVFVSVVCASLLCVCALLLLCVVAIICNLRSAIVLRSNAFFAAYRDSPPRKPAQVCKFLQEAKIAHTATANGNHNIGREASHTHKANTRQQGGEHSETQTTHKHTQAHTRKYIQKVKHKRSKPNTTQSTNTQSDTYIK